MKTGTMIKVVAVAAAILNSPFSIFNSLHAATINQVIVRQQWPWSTDVKVEYSLTGVDAAHPVDISVTAYNGDTPLPTANLASAIKGDLYGVTEEFGEFYIDPIAAFGSERIAMTKFKVKLAVSDSAANINEVIYKVFSLTNANEAVVDVTRRDLLNGTYGSVVTNYAAFGEDFATPLSDVVIWTGVTNNVKYKTSHLVMRKITCKGVQWMMGGDTVQTELAPACQVVLTNNFWISVFPVTIGQWDSLNDSWLATPSLHPSVGVYPVETNECAVACSSIGVLRIQGSGGTSYPWPTYRHYVVGTSFLGRLRRKTRYDFELPTEAQWEFAARGGNYGCDLYSGANGDVRKIAWDTRNSSPSGNSYCRHPVGSLCPNAYGLYDMLGTLTEYMLNRYYEYDTENVTYEPEGGDATASLMYRSYTMFHSYQRVGARILASDVSSNAARGIRLILPENLVYPDSEKRAP